MDKNLEHKEIAKEIKDLRQDIAVMMDLQKAANERFDEHARHDKEFQDSMLPMIKIFEDNNIVKMRISKDFKTIVFYAGGITAIAGALYVVKLFIIKFLGL